MKEGDMVRVTGGRFCGFLGEIREPPSVNNPFATVLFPDAVHNCFIHKEWIEEIPQPDEGIEA